MQSAFMYIILFHFYGNHQNSILGKVMLSPHPRDAYFHSVTVHSFYETLIENMPLFLSLITNTD